MPATRYHAIAFADADVYEKTGTMAEISAWLNGFVTIDVSSVTIGRIILEES